MRLSFISAFAILGLTANAHAHERWVKHSLKSEFDRGLFESMGLVNMGTLLVVLGIAILLLLGSGRFRAARGNSISERVIRLRPYAQLVLRVTFGLGLIIVALSNQFLAPDLVATEGIQGSLLVKTQGVLGVLLVLGLLTRFASLAVIGLFAWAMLTRPFLPFDDEAVTLIQVLNYLDVLGIAVYLAVTGGGAWSLDARFLTKQESAPSANARAKAVGLLRIFLGATLILLGIQKFLIPELPMGVVQNYSDAIYVPIANLTGISPEGYVFAACVVETTVGILVLAGLFIRPVMVILALLFVTTLFIFQEEVIPHLPLFGIVFVLLVEGAGSLRLDGRTSARRMPEDAQGEVTVESLA
jgi:uncharacterized membrane protein YphA (DoxX/SURF4 family)